MNGEKKRRTLTEDQIKEAVDDAFQRGYELGQQHGTETEKQRWIQIQIKESHRRILHD